MIYLSLHQSTYLCLCVLGMILVEGASLASFRLLGSHFVVILVWSHLTRKCLSDHLGYRFVKLSVFFKEMQLPTGPWHFPHHKAEKHPETWHTAQDLTSSLAQQSSVASGMHTTHLCMIQKWGVHMRTYPLIWYYKYLWVRHVYNNADVCVCAGCAYTMSINVI